MNALDGNICADDLQHNLRFPINPHATHPAGVGLDGNILEKHGLYLNKEQIKNIIQYAVNNTAQFGITEEELFHRENDVAREYFILAEYICYVYKHLGILANCILSRSYSADINGSYDDWFDHRQHILDLDREWNGFWTMSADNVLKVLPPFGILLDLCAGDGFYSRNFYIKQASKITCVDINKTSNYLAKRLHSHPAIEYILADVLEYEPNQNYYDVVVCRGAIEHFKQDQQQLIFKKAYSALKPGGWFCGDTPQGEKNTETGDEGIGGSQFHAFEWSSLDVMKTQLEKVFSYVETQVFEGKGDYSEANIEYTNTNPSIWPDWPAGAFLPLQPETHDHNLPGRTTLFWRARK